MKIRIEIDTSNAAFADDGDSSMVGWARDSEVARVLRAAADKIESKGIGRLYLRDVNGNECGRLTIDGEG